MLLQIDGIMSHNLCKSVCKKFTGTHDLEEMHGKLH